MIDRGLRSPDRTGSTLPLTPEMRDTFLGTPCIFSLSQLRWLYSGTLAVFSARSVNRTYWRLFFTWLVAVLPGILLDQPAHMSSIVFFRFLGTVVAIALEAASPLTERGAGKEGDDREDLLCREFSDVRNKVGGFRKA